MHRVKSLVIFHQQLSYCGTQLVDKDPMLAVPVINGLLNFWPILNSSKQILFLNELEELLEPTQPEEYKCL
jgi:serine/threonine-protein phosphatase 2A regulatory subunit B'